VLGYLLFLGVCYLLKGGYKEILGDNILGRGGNIIV